MWSLVRQKSPQCRTIQGTLAYLSKPTAQANTRSDVNLEHMRKRLITSARPDARFERDHPIDVSTAALVEVTSEDNDHPIEAALIPGELKGWRAAEPGTQTIWLIFDQPQKLKGISLVFEEKETNRTQEFVLRWSPNPESALREIV